MFDPCSARFDRIETEVLAATKPVSSLEKWFARQIVQTVFAEERNGCSV